MGKALRYSLLAVGGIFFLFNVCVGLYVLVRHTTRSGSRAVPGSAGETEAGQRGEAAGEGSGPRVLGMALCYDSAKERFVITTRFSQPMDQSRPAVGDPVKFNVPLRGTFYWEDEQTLSFVLAGVPRCTTLIGTVSEKLCDTSGTPLTGSRRISFPGASLALEDVRQIGSTGGGEPVLLLCFNDKVDPRKLSKFLSLGPEGKVGFRVLGVSPRDELKVALQRAYSGSLPLQLKKGLPAQLLRFLPQTVSRCVEVQSKLAVLGVTAGAREDSFVIKLKFNDAVDLSVLKDYLNVSPPVPFVLRRSGWDPVLVGGFKPGTAYTVSLREGLRSEHMVLKETVTRHLLVPDLPPRFGFLGEGFYLPPGGKPTVLLRTCNASKCVLRLQRLYPRNVVLFAREGRLRYVPSYSSKEFPPKEVAIRAPLNQWVTTEIDLRELFGTAVRGTFCITACLPERPWRCERTLLQITDIGITAKCSPEAMLLWTTSLRTAEPLSGCTVKVFSRSNRIVGSGVTDQNGLLRLEGPFPDTAAEKPFVVTARGGSDQAFVILSDMELALPDDLPGGRPYLTCGYEAFVWTERGVYRPGEKINAYALLRDRFMSAPGPFPVRFQVIRPDGNTWRTFRADSSRYATAQVAFSLPGYAPTGPYTIRVLGAGEEVLGRRRILCEEVRPDRMRVRARLKKKRLRCGDTVAIQVSAQHFFGKPASGRMVRGQFELFPSSFSAAGLRRYHFSGPEARRDDLRKGMLLGSRRLNEEGKAVFECEIPEHPLPPECFTAVFTFSVMEEGGRAVTTRVVRQVDPYRAYLGVAKESPRVCVGRPARFSLVAVSPGGTLAALDHLIVRVFRLSYYHSYERTSSGLPWRWVSRREENEIQCSAVLLSGGRGSFLFRPARPGRYLLKVQGEGTRHVTALAFRVDGASWSPRSFAHPAEVTVLPEKKVYHAGEEAKITVVSPFSGTCLLTVEGSDISQCLVRKVVRGSNTISVKVKQGYWPNVYLSCHIIRPYERALALRRAGPERAEVAMVAARGGGALSQAVLKAQKEPRQASAVSALHTAPDPEVLPVHAPYRGFGAALLRLDPKQRSVGVDIQAPSEVRPGDTICVALKTRAHDGSPLRTEYVLALVDEGLLSLTAEPVPDPLGFFAAVRSSACKTADPFSFLVPGGVLSPGGGQDAFSAALARRLNPVQYETPEPIAFFFGPLETSAEGEAKVELTAPDFAGSLRVVAIASNKRSVGSGRADVVVKPQITIRENFPRFLAPGDMAVVPLVFFNNEEEERTLQLEVLAEGPLSIRYPPEVTVAPEGEARVPLELLAGDEVRVAKVQLLVVGEGFHKQAEVQIPIRPAWGRVTRSGRGIAKAGGKAQKPFEGEEHKPVDFMPGTEEVTLTVSPSPLAEFAPAARYLIRYPYGCAEQTMSCFLATCAGEKLGVEDQKARAASFIAEAVERLASMQTSEGGLAMWPGGTESVPWVSAFAAHIMLEAREGNEVLIDDVLEDLLGYVRRQVTNAQQLDTRAYAAFVCALAGEDVGPLVLRLAQENLSSRGRDFVVAALRLLGRMQAAEDLRMRPVVGERDRYSYVSPVVDDAISLLTRASSKRSKEATALVDRLRKAAGAYGRWRTTHECAWAILALSKWAESMGFTSSEMPQLRILAGEKELYTGTLTRTKTFSLTVRELQNLSLHVEEGSVYFSWTACGVPRTKPREEPPEAGGDIVLRKRFVDFNGNPVTTDAFVVGRPYIVELSVASEKLLSNVVVCDLLPGGFEIENPRLASRLRWEKGPRPLRPDHVDVRDDRLLVFTTVPKGTLRRFRTFRYVVRAVAEGTFVAPGVEASCMYDPSVHAAAGGGTLVIHKEG